MNRKGKVFFKDYLAGIIEETESGYRFSYDEEYLSNEEKWPVSKTLPISEHPETTYATICQSTRE